MPQKSILQKFSQNNNRFFISTLLKRIPKGVLYILAVFLISRLILTGFGTFSRYYFRDVTGEYYKGNFAKQVWMDIWGVWDTAWYLDIAENGYSTTLKSGVYKNSCCNQNNIAFFPLYPLLIRLLGNIIGNYYISGIIISNISLLIASYFLYKITLTTDNEDFARRSIKYLFIYPSSFILSGVFSESLFLALLTATFYFAGKNKWMLVGILGFFLCLTRHVGLLFLPPLIYMYLKKEWGHIGKEILYFLLFPAGTILYFAFLYFVLGISYFNSGSEWGPINTPKMFGYITQLFAAFSFNNPFTLTLALYSVVEIFLILFYSRILKDPFKYLSYAYLLFFLLIGGNSLMSTPRFMMVLFPIFMILAIAGKNKIADFVITFLLFSLQILFMGAWNIGSFIV